MVPPFLTALVYVIVRGKGMAERPVAAVQTAQAQTESYVRGVAGKSLAESIVGAKALA